MKYRKMADWCPGGSLREKGRYVCDLQSFTLGKDGKTALVRAGWVECPYKTRKEMEEKCEIFRRNVRYL